MSEYDLEEGDSCPECNLGLLEIYSETTCSCFLGNAPCSACTNAILKCDRCEWDTDDDLPDDGSRIMTFK